MIRTKTKAADFSTTCKMPPPWSSPRRGRPWPPRPRRATTTRAYCRSARPPPTRTRGVPSTRAPSRPASTSAPTSATTSSPTTSGPTAAAGSWTRGACSLRSPWRCGTCSRGTCCCRCSPSPAAWPTPAPCSRKCPTGTPSHGPSWSSGSTASVDTTSRQLELGYDLRAAPGIDLSRNELRGEIPEGLVAMKGLEYLNLSCNYLAGQIPAGLGGMGRLRTLDFSHNGLSGEVPPGIAAMTELEVRNLSYNSLSGPLPTTDGLQMFPGALAGNPGICSGEGCTADARMPGELGGWHGENGWVSLGAFCISTMTSFFVSLATLLCSPKARSFVFRPVRTEY